MQSIAPDGTVLDSASKDLARARQHVREARKRVMDRLGGILGGLDATERAPDAAVTVRGGRYVIPIRSTARARVGGIVHDESATRSTVFVEPPEIIELGNELRAAESAELREVLRVLRADRPVAPAACHHRRGVGDVHRVRRSVCARAVCGRGERLRTGDRWGSQNTRGTTSVVDGGGAQHAARLLFGPRHPVRP